MKKIYVFGGSNIDILGFSDNQLIYQDSNRGKINISYGGVGRNIAQNIASLGGCVFFAGAVGDDEFGRLLIEHNIRHHINCDNVLVLNDKHTSTYLALHDDNKDMSIAMCDMDILESLQSDCFDHLLLDINEDDYVVIDGNYCGDLLDKLMNLQCKIIVDPISVNKVERFASYLGKITIFKPNRIEAEKLCQFALVDNESYVSGIKYFLAKNVEIVIISLGKDGVIINKGSKILRYYAKAVDMVNATGVGDSFVACFTYFNYLGLDIEECVKKAIIGSIITALDIDTCSSSLTSDNINYLLQRYEIKEEVLCILE
ncbi:MAG: carbohydrate kinase family protein [Erysipelotrichaceae bacterium]